MTVIFGYCASELFSESVGLCTTMHLGSQQSAEMPKDLQIPFRLGEMAAGEEFAGFARFYSFADAASANDVGSNTSPWRLASEECGVFAEVICAAAAEVAAFEIAVEIEPTTRL